MFKILKAEQLADKIFLMDVEAPRVAKSCEPGEFVIVKMDEIGERIPLTICDYNREAGVVTIVFQIVGASTQRMSELKAGDAFEDVVGPLGRPSEFVHEDLEVLKNKKMLFVAGGVGTAPVYPQVKWLRAHGIDADVIVGAKNKDLLILEDQMRAVAGNLYVTTDDGSYVRKGMVTVSVYRRRKLRLQGRRYRYAGEAGKRGPSLRSVCSHRTDDHDEICVPVNKRIKSPNYRQHEPDHGRWYRYVWCMSPDCW